MGLVFNYFITIFDSKLVYSYNFKSLYLIGIVLLGFFLYLTIAILIKAFKISDINLKY